MRIRTAACIAAGSLAVAALTGCAPDPVAQATADCHAMYAKLQKRIAENPGLTGTSIAEETSAEEERACDPEQYEAPTQFVEWVRENKAELEQRLNG